MVNRRKSLRTREAISISTMPSAPKAEEMATRFPKVSNAHVKARCGVQLSAACRSEFLANARSHIDQHHALGAEGGGNGNTVSEGIERPRQSALRRPTLGCVLYLSVVKLKS